MLTVQVLERFPEALERWQKAFRYVLVDEYQDTNHAQYRLLQLLGRRARERVRRRRPGPVDLRRSAAPTSATSSSSSGTSPGRTSVALEQNYRSTNAILRAANAVIEQQPRAQAEAPLVRARRGRAGRVVEVEDEHAEARFVAAEIAALVDERLSASEIAVFYRTNAQSRVLEDVLVRQDDRRTR